MIHILRTQITPAGEIEHFICISRLINIFKRWPPHITMSKVVFKVECDLEKQVCTIKPDSYSRLEAIQQEIARENMQKRAEELKIRDINSGRDTNIDSFDTFDEVYDENGNVMIRRPNIVNISNSVVKLSE